MYHITNNNINTNNNIVFAKNKYFYIFEIQKIVITGIILFNITLI